MKPLSDADNKALARAFRDTGANESPVRGGVMSAYCPEGCPDADACVVGYPCALHPAERTDSDD